MTLQDGAHVPPLSFVCLLIMILNILQDFQSKNLVKVTLPSANVKLSLWRTSIIQRRCDVIINASNEELILLPSGISGAIKEFWYEDNAASLSHFYFNQCCFQTIRILVRFRKKWSKYQIIIMARLKLGKLSWQVLEIYPSAKPSFMPSAPGTVYMLDHHCTGPDFQRQLSLNICYAHSTSPFCHIPCLDLCFSG